MSKSRRQKVFAARKGRVVEDAESPFKPGTKYLKKGWKYVDGVPVKVKGEDNG